GSVSANSAKTGSTMNMPSIRSPEMLASASVARRSRAVMRTVSVRVAAAVDMRGIRRMCGGEYAKSLPDRRHRNERRLGTETQRDDLERETNILTGCLARSNAHGLRRTA